MLMNKDDYNVYIRISDINFGLATLICPTNNRNSAYIMAFA